MKRKRKGCPDCRKYRERETHRYPPGEVQIAFQNPYPRDQRTRRHRPFHLKFQIKIIVKIFLNNSKLFLSDSYFFKFFMLSCIKRSSSARLAGPSHSQRK